MSSVGCVPVGVGLDVNGLLWRGSVRSFAVMMLCNRICPGLFYLFFLLLLVGCSDSSGGGELKSDGGLADASSTGVDSGETAPDAGILVPRLVINEFLASNDTVNADDNGEYDDWVELFNNTNQDIDIGGMYVTDDLAEPTKWQIPQTNPAATTVAAGDYMILWFDGDPDQGPLHVDTKLSASGEEIGLFESDGVTQVDSYIFGPQTVDVSEGRLPNGEDSWTMFRPPTPGAPNKAEFEVPLLLPPTASMVSGVYSSQITVELTVAVPSTATIQGLSIHYTVDGSEPTQNSPQYTTPLLLDSSTVITAKTFANDYSPSGVAIWSYLIGVSHRFPVVSLVAEPKSFFDPATGIYPNFDQDIEIPVHTTLIETDGTIGFSQTVGMEIHGFASAQQPQKSVKIKAKVSYGKDTIDYRVFPDLPYNSYRSLTLRNSGQDWNHTMFRDALISSLVGDTSDIATSIESPNIDVQGFRPSVVYINGQYWGIHNVRERSDWRYLTTHYGIDKNDVDLIENENEVKRGDLVEWQQFVDFLDGTDFSVIQTLQNCLGESI